MLSLYRGLSKGSVRRNSYFSKYNFLINFNIFKWLGTLSCFPQCMSHHHPAWLWSWHCQICRLGGGGVDCPGWTRRRELQLDRLAERISLECLLYVLNLEPFTFWIESWKSTWDHPKTETCCGERGWPRTQAWPLPGRLWWYTTVDQCG